MTRETLRLVLLFGGVAFIVALYFFEVWRRRRRERRQMPFVLDPRTEQAPASGYRSDEPIDLGAPRDDDAPNRGEPFSVGRRGDPHAAAPRHPDEAPVVPYDAQQSASAAGSRDAGESPTEARGTAARPSAGPLPGDLPPLNLDADPASVQVPSLRARPREPGGLGAGAGGAPVSGASNGESIVLVLNVMAPEGQRIHGSRLAPVLDRLGLELGDDGVYRAPPQSDGEPAYSVLNAVKPGVFEPGQMTELWTPGIALFATVGAERDPLSAFDDVLDAANTLAQELEARVCDERRHQLTSQSENHLRERLHEYTRQRRLGTR